jgi:hypothetical protein
MADHDHDGDPGADIHLEEGAAEGGAPLEEPQVEAGGTEA